MLAVISIVPIIIALGLGSLIGAVILRAAISMYNALGGGPDSYASVPEPDFGEAMGIVFVTYLVQVVAGMALGFVLGNAGMAGREDALKLQLISLPISLLVMAGMLSMMLPTTFGRGLLVAICQIIVSLLIVGVLVGIFMAVAAIA